MTEKRILHLTEENFESIISASKLVLVDFWADWCAPCRMMEPLVDLLAEQYDGQVTVAKVNIDDALDLAYRYHILSIPTVLTFRDGEEIDRQTGIMPRITYTEVLDANL